MADVFYLDSGLTCPERAYNPISSRNVRERRWENSTVFSPGR
jgi:hypothetical protein